TPSRHQNLRLAAMILAIYALVLQGLFGALAEGEGIGARLLAAELGVICAPSGHGDGTPFERSHDGSCCPAAVRAVAAAAGGLPATLALHVRDWPAVATPDPERDAVALARSTRAPPARGPPLAA